MNQIYDEVYEIAVSVTNGAAGATDIEGAVCDMAGFDQLDIIVQMGAITGGAVTSIKAQQGDAAAMGDAADLLATAQAIADDDDEQVFIISIVKPLKRYIRLYVDRATQNAVLTALYRKSKARKKPTTQGTGVNFEQHVSPIAGTA